MSELPVRGENPSDPDILMSVSGLTHGFNGVSVLRGIDFEVRRGEVFGLLGPNGSGKSTLLSLLAGLQPTQAGCLRLSGKTWDPMDPAGRSKLGVVFQDPALDLKLTALENLRLAAGLYGYHGRRGRRRAEEQLEAAGLSDRAHDPVETFSGGMKRRLDIVRALIHRPGLLLMDEPTAGLDEAAFRNTWHRLEAMKSQSELTIILATHRPDEAARCDRLAILSEGRFATIDTPEALRQKVAREIIVIKAEDLKSLGEDIHRRLDLACIHDREDEALLIECEAGHKLIPRLVESFPEGRFRSIALRRPGLADVFLKMTGHVLAG